MGNYNIGEVWWADFPFEDQNVTKHRPAIVMDDDTIAVLAMKVTSQDKDIPYNIKIEDWKEAGLKKLSWARIDAVIEMSDWQMNRKIGDLSERDLKKIMQLFVEIHTGTFHKFSLLAVIDSDGKYLQVYDERWKCWLFPSFRSEEPRKENIDSKASEFLNCDIETTYVAHTVHCKYSVSDDTYKRYDHTLYKVVLEETLEYMKGDSFKLNGKKCKWRSMNEIQNDEEEMAKNEEVIAFVKTKC